MDQRALRGRGREWAGLLALMLGYTALFVVYYPPLSGVQDEAGFVNQALVWSRGAISSEGAGLNDLLDFALIGERHLAQRHPGRSLLALPFLMVGGVRTIFVSGLLLHLAMTGIGAALLARLDRSPLWAALLLFHPTLAIYSRTIMADEAAGTGLLLAGLALTSRGAGAGLWAGLAVGLAALMRYHAGAALPVVAAALYFMPDRPHPGRDALLCLLGGGCGGGLIIAYNLAVYGTPLEPFSASRGFFSTDLLLPHLGFYAVALIVIWPAMLLAPALDRSPLRWLIRGVCGFYLVFLSIYYFYDQSPGWLETLVIGQRLLQVALPLWIISYAGVVDDWLAKPLRRWLGGRAWTFLVAVACIGLLAGTAVMFSRHQSHLNRLRAARDAMVAVIPSGSLVVANNVVLINLFGIPSGLPSYRLRLLDFQDQPLDHSRDIEQEDRPWYLAVLPKVPGSPLPKAARDLLDRYRMDPVPIPDPNLTLFVSHSTDQR
jgi:hypothetical protein